MKRREEIIKTAKKLFRERGYKSVSMRDLAKAMDIKASSLYNHINSKEEILASIALDVARYFTREMEQVKQLEMGSKAQLEAVINHHIQLTLDDPDAIAIVHNDWIYLEAVNYDLFLEMRNAYEADLRVIISDGIALGSLKLANVDVVMFSLLSTLRALHSWFRKRDDVNKLELNDYITKVLLYGIMN